MPLPLSHFASQFAAASPTRAFDKAARDLAASGKLVLFFTLGEPDFATPKNIKRAAVNAIKENFTHYTNYQGIIELRQAVCEKLKRDNNIVCSPEQVLVTAGAAEALFLTFQCLLNKGDEAIFLTPCWPTFMASAKTAGVVPVFVACSEENNFEPKIGDIRAAITANTKVIVINSPSNPTGAMLSEKTTRAICDLCREKNLWLVSDEIYEKITYGSKSFSPASIYENTVTINGASKAYSMTGWRIGFAAGPKHLIEAMSAYSSIVVGNATSVSQKAALEALNGRQSSVNKMRKEFRQRRDLIVKLINEVPGLRVTSPKGAFYVFPNVSQLFGKKTPGGKTLQNSVDVAEYFLNEAFVATVPGKPFGSDQHIRFSFACSQDQIAEGIERIKNAVAKLNG